MYLYVKIHFGNADEQQTIRMISRPVDKVSSEGRLFP